MSINFERNKTQVAYESILGITFSELESHKDEFKDHMLTLDEVKRLSQTIQEDAVDYLNNSLISFAEGIDAIFMCRFSWATVKLYYSLFYSLRASMANRNIALLQNGRMFRLKIGVSEKPFSSSNKKYSSTHSGTIHHYCDVFSSSDILQTNTIDGEQSYEWFENIRNIINYREVSFLDPECLSIWDIYKDALEHNKLKELLTNLQNDKSYTYCFQEDYAVVAFPLKRLQLTLQEFSETGLITKIVESRKEYYNSILDGRLSIIS